MPTIINGTDNSAATPALVGSDTDTGVFFPAINTMAFSTGGAEQVRIDSAGNVGIGTSSPNTRLQVNVSPASGGDNGMRVTDGTRIIQTNVTGSAYSYIGIGASETMLYSTGNPLNIVSDGQPIKFIAGTAERMRITAGGDVLVGQTAYATPPTTGTDLLAGGLLINPSRRTTGSSANCNWDATSGIFARSTSSLRYKTDVQNAAYGLSDVLKLRPVTYKGKSEADGDKLFGGFIAEEIDALGLKEFVEYDAEGRPDSLAYGNMVSLLAKAIQELKAELDSVKAELATLKA